GELDQLPCFRKCRREGLVDDHKRSGAQTLIRTGTLCRNRRRDNDDIDLMFEQPVQPANESDSGISLIGGPVALHDRPVQLAVHGVDGKTYEAVYFRPFNFRAMDSTRHAHAVQYVSHPGFPWPKLRSEHPGQFEAPVIPEPDGDAWFHARIVIERPKVSVFVNGAATPALVVNELSDR